MDSKICFFDHKVRPDPLDQFPAVHDLSSALDQSDQEIESTAAKRHRLVLFYKQPLGHNQTERPKFVCFALVSSLPQSSNLDF